MTSPLFTPVTIRGLEVRNRLWVAPMCQYSAVDGVPQEWHHTHLAQFASGGAGIVIAEASGVSPSSQTLEVRKNAVCAHGVSPRSSASTAGKPPSVPLEPTCQAG